MSATPVGNKALVLRYFDCIARADYAGIEGMLSDSVRFWLPPSVPDAAEYATRADTIRLIRDSMEGLYDMSLGLAPEITTLLAEGERVAAELVIRARSKATGLPYSNHYHFLFVIRDARIAEIHEHLDTLYAYRMLFEPLGMTEAEQVGWRPDES